MEGHVNLEEAEDSFVEIEALVVDKPSHEPRRFTFDKIEDLQGEVADTQIDAREFLVERVSGWSLHAEAGRVTRPDP